MAFERGVVPTSTVLPRYEIVAQRQEPDICPTLVQLEPPLLDCPLDAGAEFGSGGIAAVLRQERGVDLHDVNAAVLNRFRCSWRARLAYVLRSLDWQRAGSWRTSPRYILNDEFC